LLSINTYLDRHLLITKKILILFLLLNIIPTIGTLTLELNVQVYKNQLNFQIFNTSENCNFKIDTMLGKKSYKTNQP